MDDVNDLEDTLLRPRLERLTAAIIRCVSARDFDFSSEKELNDCISPNFEAFFRNTPTTPTNWDDAVKALKKQLVNDYPNSRFVLRDISSTISHKLGFATMYVNTSVEGEGSAGVTVDSLDVFMWRRNKEGKWQWEKYWDVSKIA